MEELFSEVRGCCSPRTWSRAVELARGGAVTVRTVSSSSKGEDDGDEVALAVRVPGKAASAAVTLLIGEQDWVCDCRGKADPCEHVAAAVIALRRARRAGEALPLAGSAPVAAGARADDRGQRATPALPHPAYRFARAGTKLGFERVLVDAAGNEQPLRPPLTSLVGAPGGGPAHAVASAEDLAVDRVLGVRPPSVIIGKKMIALLDALAGSGEVTLDGEPVSVDCEPVQLAAVVEDRGGGFLLRAGHRETTDEVFDNGAVRVGQTLRPVGEAPLSRAELDRLAAGRRFSADEATELATRVLPALEARLPVEVRSRRLPRASAAPPRLGLRAEVDDERMMLTLRPLVVYLGEGRQPLAAIDPASARLSVLDERAPLPLRDELAERRLLAGAEEHLGLRADRPSHFAGYEAFTEARRLAGFGGPVIGAGLSTFAPRGGALAAEVSIASDGERFEVGFSSGAGAADPARVLAAWQAGADHAPLLDGGWAPLPSDWLARHGHHLSALLAARDQREGPLPPAARLDLLRLSDALEQPPPPALEGLRPLLMDSSSPLDQGEVIRLPSTALPPDLADGVELRGYQRLGVDWLCFMRQAGLGALLADDMGLGKTLQALCAMQGRTLVVAPTSVLRNWAVEIERFRPGLRHATYHGASRALDPEADVTLTTYAILRRDVEQLAAEPWQTVILDEAQVIKNPDSQVARAAYELGGATLDRPPCPPPRGLATASPPRPFLIALTGTPVENRLEDLWSLFHWLNRGLLGGRGDFAERYGRPVAEGDAAAAARLRRRVRPFILRRLKREVAAELPPRTEVVLRCQLTERERAVYDAVRAGTREDALRALAQGGSLIAALEALLRLRQAACHPALVPGQGAVEREAGSAKLTLLIETLVELIAADHRALVFSQWTSLLDLVAPALGAAGLSWLRLDGATKPSERQRIVERFNAPDGPPVMLLSLKAGGVGLNLPAADHVFLLDPWWNPTVEDQAADRAHRIGQQRPVVVHHLVAEGTVDEKIVELQRRKRALAEAALASGDEQALAGGLGRAELLALLEQG